MSTISAKGARRSAKTARRATEKTTKPANTAKKTAKSSRATASKAAKSARSAVAKPTKATKSTKAARTEKSAKVAAKTTAKTVSRNGAKPIPGLPPEFAAAAAMIRTASPPVQPVGALETVVRSHKYRVGETVYYTSPTFGRAAATGSYTVVRLLPSDGEEQQYRIKSSGEAFERVAKESQLDRA